MPKQQDVILEVRNRKRIFSQKMASAKQWMALISL